MGNKELRRQELLSFIRRRSGRRFLVSVLSKEFEVSERTIQSDLAYLESEKQIKRQPSYNALHRQNGRPSNPLRDSCAFAESFPSERVTSL